LRSTAATRSAGLSRELEGVEAAEPSSPPAGSEPTAHDVDTGVKFSNRAGLLDHDYVLLQRALRALRTAKIRCTGKEVRCQALFDSGSGITAVRRAFFEEHLAPAG